MTRTIHASAVAINGYGVLLTGKSGSGKSDLALRLIDRGATLICDDRVIVEPGQPLPMLHSAPNIAGKLEVRGLGIIDMEHVEAIPLRLVITLDQLPERLPLEGRTQSIAGFDIPSLVLSAFEACAPIKVELALKLALKLAPKSLVDGGIVPVATASNRPSQGQ